MTGADLPDIEITAWEHGNVEPLLHEIAHALRSLVEQGKTTSIDLRALPMAPGEENRLLNTLGRGEISIQLDALGPSAIHETSFSGVWVVTHYNEQDEIMSRFIEITHCPEIVTTPASDAQQALHQLDQLLSGDHRP